MKHRLKYHGQKLGREASIYLLCTLPVLIQDAFKSNQDDVNVVQVMCGAALVYGLLLIVRALFYIAKRPGLRGKS
jgi:hypothetical protein